jgi:glycerophosphoryl diester phosphodiesterase
MRLYVVVGLLLLIALSVIAFTIWAVWLATGTSTASMGTSTGGRVKRPLVCAHRGASREEGCVENSMRAFQRAVELGVDALETDAHVTRDGVVVLSHDPDGSRVFHTARSIASSTYEEVCSWSGGSVCTLEAVLCALPTMRFIVDAKCRTGGMVPRLLDVVRRCEAEDRVVLTSFDDETLRNIRASGYANTGLSVSEVSRLLTAPIRALRSDRLGGRVAHLPSDVFGISLVTPRVVERCHALGIEVYYWTVNDIKVAERAVRLGADGIITDDPLLVKRLLSGIQALHLA